MDVKTVSETVAEDAVEDVVELEEIVAKQAAEEKIEDVEIKTSSALVTVQGIEIGDVHNGIFFMQLIDGEAVKVSIPVEKEIDLVAMDLVGKRIKVNYDKKWGLVKKISLA